MKRYLKDIARAIVLVSVATILGYISPPTPDVQPWLDARTACDPTVYADGTPAPCLPDQYKLPGE
jgi:hypothetical protein